MSITSCFMGGYTGSEFLEEFSVVTQSRAAVGSGSGPGRQRERTEVLACSAVLSGDRALGPQCSPGRASLPVASVSPAGTVPPCSSQSSWASSVGEAQLGASPVVRGALQAPVESHCWDENQTSSPAQGHTCAGSA